VARTKVRVIKKTGAIKRILDKTTRTVDRWAYGVLRYKIDPITPMLTGDLRQNTDVRVRKDGHRNVNVIWRWKQPYAIFVESRWGREKLFAAKPSYGGTIRFTTPGTEAPFAYPTIIQAIKESIGKPIEEGFSK